MSTNTAICTCIWAVTIEIGMINLISKLGVENWEYVVECKMSSLVHNMLVITYNLIIIMVGWFTSGKNQENKNSLSGFD